MQRLAIALVASLAFSAATIESYAGRGASGGRGHGAAHGHGGGHALAGHMHSGGAAHAGGFHGQGGGFQGDGAAHGHLGVHGLDHGGSQVHGHAGTVPPHHSGDGRFHHRHGVFVGGMVLGSGVFYNAYYPPVYWTAPEVVYIEQVDQQYWYFCQSAEAYHPYVTECPSGWTLVLPPPG